jgi:hypothetical protein
MKNTEMLNQIKTLLNIQVKLEEMKLENGTLISAESFEKDKEIFIITDDESKEKVALPMGDYELEDGRVLVIETEGIISDIKEKIEEKIEEKEEVVEETEDLEEEEEVVEEEKEEVKEEFATKEELGKVIDMIEEIKAMIDGKEDMSEESNVLKSRTVKEEFSEEISEEVSEEVKTELSEPSAKPIKHNPESESAKTKVNFGKSKMGATAMERVLNRLNK